MLQSIKTTCALVKKQTFVSKPIWPKMDPVVRFWPSGGVPSIPPKYITKKSSGKLKYIH